jgi:ADP-ribosylglycohydrolase
LGPGRPAGERAAGNGAAMWVAPLAFCLDPKEPRARAVIRDVCRITHHPEAYAGALAVALAVRAASEGTWNGGPTLLASVTDHLPDSRVRDRLADLLGLHGRATVRFAFFMVRERIDFADPWEEPMPYQYERK